MRFIYPRRSVFFYLSDVWVKASLIQGYVCVSSFESEVIPRSMMYDSTSENEGKYGQILQT